MAKHARQAKLNRLLVPITGALGFGAGAVLVAVGVGWVQAAAWVLGLMPSPVTALIVGCGVPSKLNIGDFRRVFEAQTKINAVFLVGTVLAYLVALSRAPLAQSGLGLVAATLVAVASWTLLAEIISIIVWDHIVRRHHTPAPAETVPVLRPQTCDLTDEQFEEAASDAPKGPAPTR